MLGDIVDAVALLVGFAIGVDHWSLVAFLGETFPSLEWCHLRKTVETF